MNRAVSDNDFIIQNPKILCISESNRQNSSFVSRKEFDATSAIDSRTFSFQRKTSEEQDPRRSQQYSPIVHLLCDHVDIE